MTEGEYMAMKPVNQEILFVQTLLKDVMPLECPAIMLKDYMGAIF